MGRWDPEEVGHLCLQISCLWAGLSDHGQQYFVACRTNNKFVRKGIKPILRAKGSEKIKRLFPSVTWDRFCSFATSKRYSGLGEGDSGWIRYSQRDPDIVGPSASHSACLMSLRENAGHLMVNTAQCPGIVEDGFFACSWNTYWQNARQR